MNSDAPLDYVEFQISPKRTRCELFVSSGTCTEKLASGLLQPFVVNLKVAEEKVASAAQSFKLEVGRSKCADYWFTKGTLERFVRYVSSPDVFELVNTFDAEMSQLEAAQKIYSQGTGGQPSGGGGSTVATPAADDATKKELQRAIDLRLGVLQQDLSNACARAVAAGFNVDSVSDLKVFADSFRAHRLNEACSKFISLCERRPNLTNQWKSGPKDRAVRSSCGSDMSIDDDPSSPPPPRQKPVTFPIRRTFSRDSISEGDKRNDAVSINGTQNEKSTPDPTESMPASQPVRRLSVQDKINMFENKQKDHSCRKSVAAVAKPVELRRMSSDVSTTMGAAAVLRRWSGVSDMSVDSSFEKKDTPESPLSNPSSSSSSAALQEYNVLNFNNDNRSKEGSNKLNSVLAPGESDGSKDQLLGKAQSWSIVKNQENLEEKLRKLLGGKSESVVDLGDGAQPKILGGAQSQTDMPNRGEYSKSKAAFATQPNAGESGVRIREAFAARYQGAGDSSPSGWQEVKSAWETEVVEKNEESRVGSEKESSGHVSGVEDSGPRRMKFSRRGLATKLDKQANIQTVAQDGFDSFTTPPPNQFQKARQIKGNQELNDELKTKANELEKLFDEHKKLQTPGDDQFNFSPHKSKNYQTNKPIGSSKNKIKLNVLKKTDSQDLYGDDLSKSFSKLSVSEGSRGKLYDKYMKKRNAKLKEDWSSNRAEKEARLKSMQDSLERNRSEMNAKFLGSSASRRAERLRSYNSMPIINMQQQYLDIEDGLDDGMSYGDGISNMILPNNSNLPVPRSTAKTSMKRRTQLENPLTYISDLRNEKTKSSPIGSKTDKSLRLSSKSSANQSNSSDGVVFSPIKFNEEIQKSVLGTKTFPGKAINHASGFRTGNVLYNDGDVVSLPDEEFETNVKDKGVVEEIETFDTFSRVDQALGSHMPVDISNPHEISDVVECPSWNSSQSFSQMEMEADADSARMRKKWETDQKPVLVVPHSSSNLVARKDTTSGFKRFLKFGRRNRGVSESLADWVSVTTSEGEEDTEDGGDSANRSSEDLRKSRMGFSQGHPSDDNEFFNESAPRSFFSLSTFRSKGSESKPR